MENPRILWLKKMRLVSSVLMQNSMAAKLIKEAQAAAAKHENKSKEGGTEQSGGESTNIRS